MAHEIDMSNGRANAMIVGEPAWHRLGVNVSDAQTSDEAIRLAGLDWQVEQWQAQATLNGLTIDVPGYFANVRGDTHVPLAVVSQWYRPFQNREAFDFMDSIVGEKLAMFETAGSLKGGKTVWMMARLPKELRAGGDVTHPYLLLTNTHDGTRALRMIPTAIRVVCWNTLTFALNAASRTQGITIPHFESLERRVKEARESLGIIAKRLDRYEEEMQALKSRRLTRDELCQFFATVIDGSEAKSEKGQKKLGEAFSAALEHETNRVDGMQGTAWAAYNAVSLYSDHQTKVLGTGARAADNRLNSIWFGQANSMKQNAYKAVMTLVS